MRLQTARVPGIGLKVTKKSETRGPISRIDSNWPHQHIPKCLKQTFPSPSPVQLLGVSSEIGGHHRHAPIAFKQGRWLDAHQSAPQSNTGDDYLNSIGLILVLLDNDSGRPLDTYSLYHIGLGVPDKAAVIESYVRAKAQA